MADPGPTWSWWQKGGWGPNWATSWQISPNFFMHLCGKRAAFSRWLSTSKVVHTDTQLPASQPPFSQSHGTVSSSSLCSPAECTKALMLSDKKSIDTETWITVDVICIQHCSYNEFKGLFRATHHVRIYIFLPCMPLGVKIFFRSQLTVSQRLSVLSVK